MTLNFKIWKDILKETDPNGVKSYSQGRVYLFISIIAYYLALTIVTWKAMHPNTDISDGSLKTIIDALQWAILLFASYAFGGKVIGSLKTIFGKNPLDTPPAENK